MILIHFGNRVKAKHHTENTTDNINKLRVFISGSFFKYVYMFSFQPRMVFYKENIIKYTPRLYCLMNYSLQAITSLLLVSLINTVCAQILQNDMF